MKRFMSLSIFFIIAVFVSGCGNSGGSSDSTKKTEATLVSVGGGMAASSDGAALVEIPAGALSEETKITVGVASGPTPGAVGTAYDFGPDGLIFDEPVTIEIAYDETAIPAGFSALDLRLGKLVDGALTPVDGSVVDTIGGVVSGTTSSFSVYGVVTGFPESPMEDKATLYQQPFQTDPSGFFSNIGGQVGADQFTLSVNASIATLRWYGIYNGVDLDPAVTSIVFDVSFFSDNGGLPDMDPIYQKVISASVKDTAFAVTDPGFQNGRIIYEFSVDLVPSLMVTAGQTVWLSIAETDASTPAVGDTQWLWSFSPATPADTKAFRNTNPSLESGWEPSAEFGQLAFALFETTSPDLDPPRNLNAVAENEQVTISWNAVSGATSYNVFWNTTGGVTTADTLIPGVTSPHMHSSLTNGTTYYYIVTAVNAIGESDPSSEVSGTPMAVVTVPDAPQSVQAFSGDGQVTISWNAVSGATSYNIYWNTTGGVTTSDNKIADVTSPYTHIGLTNGTTYFYMVTAINDVGESNPSMEASDIPTDLEVLGIFSETAPEALEFDVDSFIGIFTGGGATFDEFFEDTVELQEGSLSMRATVSVNASAGGFAGWFVSWGNADRTEDNSFVRDMSLFEDGSLTLWVKSPIDLEVGVRSGNVKAGFETSKVLLSQFDSSVMDNSWHEICVPLSVFEGSAPKADLSRVKVFFVIASNTPSGGTGGVPKTFWIDDVRWEGTTCP